MSPGGRRSIKAYAAYLDTLEDAEEAHPACTANRLLLEHTWQVAALASAQRSARRDRARSDRGTLAPALAPPPRRVLEEDGCSGPATLGHACDVAT